MIQRPASSPVSEIAICLTFPAPPVEKSMAPEYRNAPTRRWPGRCRLCPPLLQLHQLIRMAAAGLERELAAVLEGHVDQVAGLGVERTDDAQHQGGEESQWP